MEKRETLRVLLLGGVPARVVNEYPITLRREERRESEAFLREVEKVRAGLRTAIQSAQNEEAI